MNRFSILLLVLALFNVYGRKILERGRGKERLLQRIEENDDDGLFFSITYRDFLPAACLTQTQNAGVLADAYNRNVNNLPNLNQRFACNDLITNSRFVTDFNNQAISGHPDFNALPFVGDIDPCTDDEDGVLPIGTCRFEDGGESIVNLNLDFTHPSGIPKPEYCRDGAEDTCGIANDPAGRPASSQKQFFDMWFTDDRKFNKRVGQRLRFTRNPADADEFQFQNGDDDAPDFGDNNGDLFGPLDRFKVLIGDSEDDPKDLEGWPRAFNIDDGFLFTTELHTTFQFDASLDNSFTFAGDDDFLAYINNQLAIDLQGLHGSFERTIDLRAEIRPGVTFADELGLFDGGIFNLDIFHAERQCCASNFAVDTTLRAACNVVQSGAKTIDLINGITASEDDFVLRGVDLNNGVFGLTSGERDFQANSFFTTQVQNLEFGFIASFTVTASSNSAPNGFAFVIQNEGVVDLPVSNENFNFGGLTQSLAVVFDLCLDRDEEVVTCNDKSVSIHFPDNFNQGNDAGDATRRVNDAFQQRDFERADDRELFIEVIYFGGDPDFLEVYIDESLYLRQSGFDLEEVIGATGGHVGFTATTAIGVNGDLDISGFSLTTVIEEPELTLPLFDKNDFEVQLSLADGERTNDGFIYQTRDFCVNDINAGGLADLFTVVFTEQPNENGLFFGNSTEPNIETVPVVDNEDGTYSVVLVTEVPGNYSFDLEFGDNCIAEGDPADNCFRDDVANAVEVLALEDADELLEDDNGAGNPVPIALGSVGAVVLGILFIVLFVRYKKEWDRKKGYIADGREMQLVANTPLATDTEMTIAAKKLLQSQKEILELRARAENDERLGDISKLELENTEMQEVLKQNKAAAEMTNANDMELGMNETNTKAKYGKKLDFTI